jgi:hypothetical protein
MTITAYVTQRAMKTPGRIGGDQPWHTWFFCVSARGARFAGIRTGNLPLRGRAVRHDRLHHASLHCDPGDDLRLSPGLNRLFARAIPGDHGARGSHTSFPI